MEELSEGMRQLAESFGNQSKLINDQFEKDKKYSSWEEEDHKRQKANSKDVREAEIKQLGYYRDELGIIRESVDLRKSENQQKKEAINQIKKDVGEEAFLRRQQQKLLSEELDKIEQNNSAYANMAKNAQRAAKAMESPGEAIKSYTTEHGRQLDSLNSIVGAGKDSLYDMAKGSKLATGGLVVLESVATLAAGALSGVMKASMAMGKELINGQRGMAVGAKGVSAFTHEMAAATKTVGTALTSLGAGIIGVAILLAPFTGGLSLGALALGGLAVGAGLAATASANVAETLAELNEIAAQLNDKLFAGFNELGKMSMTAAGGMTDISEKLHKMGMTVAEFDKFKTVVAANSKEMKMFGSTMSEGLTRFTDASAALYESESSKMFQRMGITIDEQYEHTAKYMALQSRLGLLQEKNAKDVAKSAANYIEELDKIAAITGVTRKEQEDARNAVMAIEQLRAGILDEQRKADQGDPGAKARLEKLERALEVSTQLQAQGLTKAATGTAQYYGAGGRVTTMESVEARRNLGATFKAIDEGKGSKTSRAMLAEQEMVDAAKKYAGARRIQTGEGDMAGIFSDKSAAAGDLAAKRDKLAREQAAEEKKLGRKFSDDERDKFFKDFEDRASKDRKATDKTTADNVDLVRNQQQAAIKLDEAAKKFTDSVGVNKLASDTFAAAVKKFDEYLNGKTGGSASSTKAGSSAPPLATTGGGAATGARPSMRRSGGGAGGGGTTDASGRMGASSDPRVKAVGGGNIEASQLTIDDIVKFTGNTGSKDHFSRLDPAVSAAFTQMAGEIYNTTGHRLQINSSFRSAEEQEKVNSGTNPKAKAGQSKHNFGRALDLNSYDVELLKTYGLLDKYGFKTIANDPPHIEMARTGGVFSGPSSGYPVMLHGREAVVPQANFKDIKKETLSSGSTSPSQGPDEVVGLLADMVETMSDKLDQVINKLGDGNDIQGKILNYSMA